MSWIVRLYPRAWRERYGDEVLALLEDRPPGPRASLDLLFGAMDAHVHHVDGRPRTVGVPSVAGVLAAVAAGLVWIVAMACALAPAATPSPVTAATLTCAAVLFVVAARSVGRVRSWTGQAARSLSTLGVASMVIGWLGLWVASIELCYLMWFLGFVVALVGVAGSAMVTMAMRDRTRMGMVLLVLAAAVQAFTILAMDHDDGRAIMVGAAAVAAAWIRIGVHDLRPGARRPLSAG